MSAVPAAILEDRIALVGTSGAGKTFAARGMVERLIAAGARVCAVDPLGVWWGLRTGADGDPAGGLPVMIFGGTHADVPITEHDGAALARVIATADIRCVVDVSELGSGAARRRFMSAFTEALYDTNRLPLHLVLDEADSWAPQRPVPEGRALQGKISEIVRRGRVRGFVPWLLTQRPAVLDKDVLSMADVLVAMKLTSSQDRAAIGAWIEGQADRQDGKRILADLPRLQQGEGFLWAPGHGMLEKFRFPPNATFDSSRTPKRGERIAAAGALKSVNAEGIAALLAARRDDDGTAAAAAAPRSAAIAAAYERGLREGRDQARDELLDLVRAIGAKAHEIEGLITGHFYPEAAGAPAKSPPLEERPATTPRKPPRTAPDRRATPSGGSAGNGTLHAAARAILAVLAARAPTRLTWQQAATLAGLKARGGHFNAGRQQLRAERLIAEQGPLVWATEAGLARSGADAPWTPSTAAEVRDMWCGRLPSPAPAMIRELARIGRPVTPAELAAELGKEPRGGHWNSGVAVLRNNGLIHAEAGTLRLAEDLRDA